MYSYRYEKRVKYYGHTSANGSSSVSNNSGKFELFAFKRAK